MNNTSINDKTYNPNYATPPGKSVQEALTKLGMSQSELAKRINRPEKTISEIINGITAITPETAIQFERALGISASFWNKLERDFQETKARIEAKKKLEEEIELAHGYPYKDMARWRWVKDTKEKITRVEELLKYFGVNSLTLVNKVFNTENTIAFRKHNAKTISQEALAAWIRKGELDSYSKTVYTFNERMLKSLLEEFKSMTFEEDFANKILPILQKKLADCGVVLLFVPDLPNTYVCGLARWLSSDKALIQLSLRGKYADIMWFTLYHEIGHLLLHGKREKFIDYDKEDQAQTIVESQADNFASEFLISDRMFNAFLQIGSLTVTSVKSFSEKLNIHPSILVGRLLHAKVIDYSDREFNDLRIKYD